MLYHLLYPLAESWHALNLFRYITFRTGGAILTALLISFVWGKDLIGWLKSKQGKGQPIRTDGPIEHLVRKQGTPTMGGVLILLAFSVSTLLWADLTNLFVWAVLVVTLGYGAIGFADDYLKVTKQSILGLGGWYKVLYQMLIGAIGLALIIWGSEPNFNTVLTIPFLKNIVIDLGLFYSIFGLVVLIGASNAVNLTDGLDGLAVGPVIIASLCFGVIAYLVGNHVFAHYLQLHFVPGSGELAVLCGALIGAGLGFLWFNSPPAMVFMGDTGSLAMGGALGTMSLITKHEIVLAIIGGLFVVEALSVIVQVGYFKMTGGKRIFLMAPLHHHFEKKGWSEPTIVIRFWIISIILALLGLATLKLR